MDVYSNALCDLCIKTSKRSFVLFSALFPTTKSSTPFITHEDHERGVTKASDDETPLNYDEGLAIGLTVPSGVLFFIAIVIVIVRRFVCRNPANETAEIELLNITVTPSEADTTRTTLPPPSPIIPSPERSSATISSPDQSPGRNKLKKKCLKIFIAEYFSDRSDIRHSTPSPQAARRNIPPGQCNKLFTRSFFQIYAHFII